MGGFWAFLLKNEYVLHLLRNSGKKCRTRYYIIVAIAKVVLFPIAQGNLLLLCQP